MIVAAIILVFFIVIEVARRIAIRYYERLRDKQDFTTEWGKTLIEACNEKINLLRYFELWLSKIL